MTHTFSYFKKTLTIEQMKEISDCNSYIEVVITISESEMFYNDFEIFSDLISKKICDNPCSIDIQLHHLQLYKHHGIYITSELN